MKFLGGDLFFFEALLGSRLLTSTDDECTSFSSFVWKFMFMFEVAGFGTYSSV